MLAITRVFACQGLATRTKVFELLESGPLTINRAPGPSVPARWAQDKGLIAFSGTAGVEGTLDLATNSLTFADGSPAPVVKRPHGCAGTVYVRHRDFQASSINALDMRCPEAKAFIHAAGQTNCLSGECQLDGFSCDGDGAAGHVYERCVGDTRQLEWTFSGDY